jgi:hypothetical protein
MRSQAMSKLVQPHRAEHVVAQRESVHAHVRFGFGVGDSCLDDDAREVHPGYVATPDEANEIGAACV